MASMESAIQETREFLENLDLQEILVNGVTQEFQGFVMFPCVIRRTTSGNITAKDPTSDDVAAWEQRYRTHPSVSRRRFTVQRCDW